MAEFVEACTGSPINLALSLLLIAATVYWLLVILGGLGMDSLDVDFDGDLDVDAPHGGLASSSAGVSVMRFLGMGEVPLLVLLTVFLFILWAVGVLAYPWFGSWGVLLQLLALLPAMIVASITTTLVTWPLRAVFRRIKAMEAAEQQFEFVGQRVRIVSLTADAKSGQAEIETSGAPLRLNVRLPEAATPLNRGDEAVIVQEAQPQGVYLVRPF